jgi:hypothetical protein
VPLGLRVDALGMSEAADSRRRIAAVVAWTALLLAGLVAVIVWDPVGSVVRAVGLPDLPDVPRWLLWALGKVKFVVVAVVALVVVLRELRRPGGA